MRTLIALALSAAIAGCATPTAAERAAQMQKEVDEMIQIYGPACEKLGFSPDTDKWRECILNLNRSQVLEHYSTQPATTQCWGHRGFFQCSSF